MNKVIMMGRLTADPDIRYSYQNEPIARFRLAVDRRFSKDTTDFFSCVAFRRNAEFVERYLRKGKKILIEGELQNNNYTDRNGVKRYDMQIVLENIEFAESRRFEEESRHVDKREEESRGGYSYAPATERRPEPKREPKTEPIPDPLSAVDEDGFMDINDIDESEIPFM